MLARQADLVLFELKIGTYPGIAYPMVQKRPIYFEPEIQLLLLLAVDLLNGPFLELVRGYRAGCIGRKGREEERQGAGWRGMVIRGGDFKVDPDEFQVRLDAGR